MTKLKEQHRLTRVGSVKSGHWEIVEELVYIVET